MKTILLIDDDHRELDIISQTLTAYGYRVLVAEDGETGIQRAMFAKPDMILLDVCMPGIDGYETCDRLRKNERTRDIPIILKTCLSSVQSIVNGFKYGADDFLMKPVDHDELLNRIKFRIGKTPLENAEAILSDLQACVCARSSSQ